MKSKKRLNVWIAIVIIFIFSSCNSLKAEDIKNTANNKWTSSKWGYSITFPTTWDIMKKDNFNIMSPNVDIYCEKNESTSAAVFVYSYHASRNMEKDKEKILSNYINNSEFEMLIDETQLYNNHKYRTIIFKSGEHIHNYTVIFLDNMQIWVSSVCKEDDYSNAKDDFEFIIDSFEIMNDLGTKIPYGNQNRWESERWDYTVTFPMTWNKYKKIQPYESEHADVVCNTWWGSETVIYTYIKPDDIALNIIIDDVLGQYQSNSRYYELLEGDSLTNGNVISINKVFKFTPYNYQGMLFNYYTGIFTDKILLLISSVTTEENYTYDEEDFKLIVDSILDSLSN
ncbi:MAG: hypothetical protein JEY96_19090 [Bacteroidales bacterium]|nr:hypothetical protein [Bacteroidales bacterium]